MTEESFQNELKEKCIYFEDKCNSLLKYDIVKKVNVRGLVAGIILNDVDLTSSIVENCIREGVLVMSTKRESIKLGPPLTISKDALPQVFEVIESNIKKEIKNELDI